MAEVLICPICKAGLNNGVQWRTSNINTLDCPNCGNYKLGDTYYEDFIANNELTAEQLAVLSYAIHRLQRHGNPPRIVEETASNILQNTRLPDAVGRLDNLILYLGQILSEPGATVLLVSDNLRAKLGTIKGKAAIWTVKQVIENGLIQGIPEYFDNNYFVNNATLSIEGWRKFTELQANISESKKAFMAMQYGDAELDNVFHNCFKPAAELAGYELVKLNEQPRAGLIDDRLRLEIRTSRFLIADLSHANNGAYWEAGYAEGLGRPVIYTCKKAVFKNPKTRPHFDTNHYLTVLWDAENLQEATDELKITIRASLPSEAKLSD